MTEDTAMVMRVAKAINGPHHPAPDMDKLRDIRWNMLDQHEQIFTMNIARAVLTEVDRLPAEPTGKPAIRIVITTNGADETTFKSVIPTGQGWYDTLDAMNAAMFEFRRQFEDSDLCPFKRKRDQ